MSNSKDRYSLTAVNNSNFATAQETLSVKELVEQIYAKNIVAGQDAIILLSEEYKRKYSYAMTCHLYHKMIGSTLSNPTHANFPGQDSVINRLKQILDSI